MFYITKQLRGLFMGMVCVGLESGANNWADEMKSTIELVQMLAQENAENTKEVKQQMQLFVDSLDKNADGSVDFIELNDQDKSKYELIKKYLKTRSDLTAYHQALCKLVIEQKTIDIQVLKDLANETKEVVYETKDGIKKVLSDVETEESFKELNYNNKKVDVRNLDSLRKDVNVPSLKKMMESMKGEDFNEFLNKVQAIFFSLSEKEELKINTKKKNQIESLQNKFNQGDITSEELSERISEIEEDIQKEINQLAKNLTKAKKKELTQLFEQHWYEADTGWFDGGIDMKEAGLISSVLMNVMKTQLNIPNMSFKEKLAIVLDYNTNGVVSQKDIFINREREVLEAIDSEEKFENLLQNLGYADKAEFDTAFSTNYYVARADFKERLENVVEATNVNVWDAINDSEAAKKAVEQATVLKDEAETIIDANPKMQELCRRDKELYEKVKFNAVGAVLGAYTGGAVGFDVKELTNNLIDSVHFGIVDGVPGFGIAKVISQGERYSVAIGITNFIPHISATLTIKQANFDEISELGELFPMNVDSSLEMVGFASLTAKWAGFGIDFSLLDDHDSKGIERMMKQTDELLDTVFDCIESGAKFEESWIEQTSSNKKVYDRLQSIYTALGGTEVAAILLKKGALDTYRNELFRNADSFNVTGIALGWLDGKFAIGVHGDQIDTSWEQTQYATLGSIETKGPNLLDVFDKTAYNNVKPTLSALNQFLKEDALEHDNTPGMKALQLKIHEFINEESGDLKTVWNEYKAVFSAPKITLYSKEHQVNWAFWQITDSLEVVDPAQQIFILKQVAVNLMKKDALEATWQGEFRIGEWKTLAQYDADNNRADFFDKIFAVKCPDIADEIKTARQTYISTNWNITNFSTGLNSSNGLGFSGVEMGLKRNNKKVTGLNTYTGGYHYANMGSIENSFVDIPGRSPNLINNLPDRILEWFRETLNKQGHSLADIQAVKAFINNEDNGVTYKLKFCRDPECLNDKIIIDDLNYTKVTPATNGKIDQYGQVNKVVKWWVTWVKPEETPKPKKEEPKDDKPDVSSKPKTEEVKDQSTSPGTDDQTSGETENWGHDNVAEGNETTWNNHNTGADIVADTPTSTTEVWADNTVDTHVENDSVTAGGTNTPDDLGTSDTSTTTSTSTPTDTTGNSTTTTSTGNTWANIPGLGS